MNDFDKRIHEIGETGLEAYNIETVQVNVGLKCNNLCNHCHVQASPEKKEIMNWNTMQIILKIAEGLRPKIIDITGGSPELNPFINRFIKAIKENGFKVQIRTNLTALLEPTIGGMISFYRENEVKLVASLPCYLKEETDSQRGEGVFKKSINVLNKLNSIGYGSDPKLILDLVYNPEGPFLPPEQSMLEAKYKEELYKKYGIVFNNLLNITNMPIGRFLQLLRERRLEEQYMKLLQESFNPKVVDKLMCRHQINIAWNGLIYDCDFNFALGLNARPPAIGVLRNIRPHISNFNQFSWSKRRIVTGKHCFGCTAGHGSSCSGSLE